VETFPVSSNFRGMQKVINILFIIFSLCSILSAKRWEVVSSDVESLTIDIRFDVEFPADLQEEYITIGLPSIDYPQVESNFSLKKSFTFDIPDTLSTGIEWISSQTIHSLHTATIRISPHAENQEYYSRIQLIFHFESAELKPLPALSKHKADFLKHKIANWETAQRWLLIRDTLSRITGTGSEHVIIGPSQFESACLPLLQHRGNSQYVRLDSIYSQFSDGVASPDAIRKYILWAYENWEVPPIYILLVGDIEWIETLYGYDYNGPYAVDDLFVTPYSSYLTIASIGRYPAHTVDDVEAFVTKLINYETEPEYGPWRTTVTLVADDAKRPEPNHGGIETGKSHTRYSENVADHIPNQIDLKKIYMMDYPEVTDASAYGVIKPDATEAIFTQLEEGTAVINYIGHGEPGKWAQEQLLSKNRGDIHSIQTGMKLPIWIAATCSWGYFDDPQNDAFSEDIIRLPENGASAIIATTRNIGINTNAQFVENLFETLFEDGHPSESSLGTILQTIKNGSSDGRKFHLFGDPATVLPFPTSIASVDSLSTDTLVTLTPATYFGSQPFEGMGGTGYISITEGNRFVTRYYTISGSDEELSYFLPGASLFRGQFSYSGDQFTGELIVPKDISNMDSTGYIRTYTLTNNNQEGLGVLGSVRFASGGTVTDTEGPMIQFESSSGRRLLTGDHFANDEDLVLRLSDINGINLTKEIGHEIMMTNLISDQQTDITNRFVYDMNQITSGTINLPLNQFDSTVKIRIKAWDNANNPTEREITLIKSNTDQLQLFQVYNFPNPFRSETQFAFELTAAADVKIDIYTLGGRRIHSIDQTYFPEAGYYTINWDGNDYYGQSIANGVYLYRIKATNSDKSVSIIEKLAKYR